MFIGSINSDTRKLIAKYADGWKGSPVYVGCSGNFTIERILSKLGFEEIHGNDVSLYSCVLGSIMTDGNIPVSIRSEAQEEWGWLEQWMGDPVSKAATLLLATTVFQYYGKDAIFYKRMWSAYLRHWAELHLKTADRVRQALGEVKLTSFFPGDVVTFMEDAPKDSVFLSFPPTYTGGYEALYAQINSIFEWDEPKYKMFDKPSFDKLAVDMQQFSRWMTMRDYDDAALKPFNVAVVHSSLRARPVYLYAGEGSARITTPKQSMHSINIRRLKGEVQTPLKFVKLEIGEFNYLRSQYLNPGIMPASPTLCLALVDGKDELIGCIGMSPPHIFGFCDMYMMSDFCVRPSSYKRLSKLVIAAALSTEMKAICEQSISRRVNNIGTTAFTEKPMSMKYRGVFTVKGRGQGKLNYIANAGRWSLEEAYDWWINNHASHQETFVSAVNGKTTVEREELEHGDGDLHGEANAPQSGGLVVSGMVSDSQGRTHGSPDSASHRAVSETTATSGIEGLVYEELERRGIGFTTQVPIGVFVADIVLDTDDKNIIEVYGCYWHLCEVCGYKDKNQRRAADGRKRGTLKRRGYTVASIWEHEVKQNVEETVTEALSKLSGAI